MENKKHLSCFEQTTEYTDFKNSDEFVLPQVSLCKDTNKVHYNKKTKIVEDYSLEYFSIKNTGNDTLYVLFNMYNDDENAIFLPSYHTDSATNDWVKSTSTVSILPNEEVHFKANLKQHHTIYCLVEGQSTYSVQGNIMSLVFGDNFEDQTDLTGYYYVFAGMFGNSTNLIDASNLILPATTLSSYCYGGMFSNCTGLTTAPALPATTLTEGCYSHMFAGCSSLTEAPELPATALADSCYYGMFRNCTSLTVAPALPATTLAKGCYTSMFRDCTNINRIVMLGNFTDFEDCLYRFAVNVASEGTFVKYSNLTIIPDGVIPEGWNVEWLYEFELSDICFKIKPLEDVQVTIEYYGASPISLDEISTTSEIETYSFDEQGVLHYSLNGTNWQQLNSGEAISITSSDTMYLIGMINGINSFNVTGPFNVEGNIMSLLYGENFISACRLENSLSGLFENCTNLIDASNLILPATTLTEWCYSNMFYGCTSLTGAPELPTTTLADYCYARMFAGCSSLTEAPALPAMSLTQGCYGGMFDGCSSLETAPELPATTIYRWSYSDMFNNCTSLTTAPELPVTTLAEECCAGMFNGCTTLTVAPALPATTLADYCYARMFAGCTSLTTSPELPATTLEYGCYQYMFQGCTSLNHITMLASDISTDICLYNWVNGVAPSGTFIKRPNMTSLSIGDNGIPEGWVVEDKPYNFNGHEYVDLGLPSGTLWATKSIGAETEEDYGLYFAWGSTEGYTAEEVANDFILGLNENEIGSGVPYMDNMSTPTKYNSEDGKTVLDLEDDAAHVNMGGDWHMPTPEQLDELLGNTTYTWTTKNDIDGVLFTASNGNSLFVPIAGVASYGGVTAIGGICFVWSSSVYEDAREGALGLALENGSVRIRPNFRALGFPMRGVVGYKNSNNNMPE